MHAAGHAALAVAAGGCAQALAGGPGLLAWRSGGAAFGPLSRAPWLGGGALSFAIVGLVAVVVKAAGGAWASWEQARVGGEVGGALRLRALDGWLALHRLHGPRHADHGSARSDSPPSPAAALAALTYQVRELEAGLDAGVLGAARAVVQIAPLALLLGWMAPGLAAVACLAFLVFSLGLGRARRAWKRSNAKAAEHREALLGAADEAVRHAELWTTYGAERRVRSHLESIGRALASQGARIEASASALSGANEVLGAIALVLAIAAGRQGWLGAAGQDAVLLPFAVTFFLAYRPIRDLTDARLALSRASVAADGLAPLFTAAERADQCEPGRGEEASARAWALEALEVSSLQLARGVVGGLSFRVPAGSVLAIVGATGSGKTTLLRTLLGLEVPHAGAIRYGAARIEALPSGPASRPFAWVPQDSPLLADTLDANIGLAPGADDPRAALATIGATSLADAVGAARLGAGGRRISGGERQWVALARAVATRLPVLLLDEPTSGLDAASQERVLQAIARLKGARTVILVTHREEPLAIADEVLRIDGFAPSAATRAA
jgi:ABC-type transport system involved in cytochrome bd biosynthesis fused ATPase/permease subunit